ncbi:unnamed protein product [Miscanthus lutarioriparius]|uniref:Retrovirus-related Pol polyprotein from transposon TNT 1-94-like beta-barrel domain-containing protein n=1 Tax=Miscanthus lutarioriparius TaxID=422564 RepID=A0A811RXB0_9POAL|nr:unnamed protein product [Miscanthus lutarioriparius]
MKFDLPLLDYKTRFALWQVKMRAILAQSLDLDEALDSFRGKGQKSWIAEEKRKDRDVLVVFAGCVAGRDEWILDSACSFHICSNRDWFSSYESAQSGDVVCMKDNNPCEIVGIGSIQIKMHDGMIRTLKDMRHIPGMARKSYLPHHT